MIVWAPANSLSDIHPQYLDLGIRTVQNLGIPLEFAEHVHHSYELPLSRTVSGRIQDFHSALQSEKHDIIMAAFGGYTSNQLLDYIDYDCVAACNKKIIGYSDVSIILNAIFAKTNRVTYHGPAFATFCDPCVSDYTLSNFKQVVMTEQPVCYRASNDLAEDDWFLHPVSHQRQFYPHPGWQVFNSGQATGHLVGGHLETFNLLIGTDYLPDPVNKILLIEANKDESPRKFERDLTRLSATGYLDEVSGLIVGQFGRTNTLSQSEFLCDVLSEHLQGQKYPVLYGVNCSHVDPILTLPIGGEINLFSGPMPHFIYRHSSN